jgi:hypothetical protein
MAIDPESLSQEDWFVLVQHMNQHFRTLAGLPAVNTEEALTALPNGIGVLVANLINDGELGFGLMADQWGELADAIDEAENKVGFISDQMIAWECADYEYGWEAFVEDEFERTGRIPTP